MYIIYTDKDGSVSIVYPVSFDNLSKEIKDLTQDEYKKHVFKVSVPDDSTNAVWVESNTIPVDNYFRNAWSQNGNSIEINLDKAKEIRLNNLRIIRNEKLKQLDSVYMAAFQKKDGSDLPLAEKMQNLRDMPNVFNSDSLKINNVDELKNYTPDILKI